jgi:hypothetical protein
MESWKASFFWVKNEDKAFPGCSYSSWTKKKFSISNVENSTIPGNEIFAKHLLNSCKGTAFSTCNR